MLRTPTSPDDYLESQVRTASPERLHLMVVEAALRFGRQALEAMARNDRETVFLTLSRSRACVAELLSAVKPEPNRELAEQLRALFNFVHRRLAVGELQNRPQAIEEALAILERHRTTWLELVQQLHRTSPAPALSVAPQSSWVA